MDGLSVYTVRLSHIAPSPVIKLPFTATACGLLFISASFINPDKQIFILHKNASAICHAREILLRHNEFDAALLMTVDTAVSRFVSRASGFRKSKAKGSGSKGRPCVSRDPQVHCSYGPREAGESPDLKSTFKKKWGWKTLQLFLRRPAERQAVVWP